jgi:hypothetical protein
MEIVFVSCWAGWATADSGCPIQSDKPNVRVVSRRRSNLRLDRRRCRGLELFWCCCFAKSAKDDDRCEREGACCGDSQAIVIVGGWIVLLDKLV